MTLTKGSLFQLTRNSQLSTRVSVCVTVRVCACVHDVQLQNTAWRTIFVGC